MGNIYNELKMIDKEGFLNVIGNGKVELICDAAVRAAHFIHDYDWLLKQYELLLRHHDVQVRGAVITCVGHLARLNECADKVQLLEILESMRPETELLGRIEDAADDVNTFL